MNPRSGTALVIALVGVGLFVYGWTGHSRGGTYEVTERLMMAIGAAATASGVLLFWKGWWGWKGWPDGS